MLVAKDEMRWEARDISPTESVLDPVGVWLKTEKMGPKDKGELFMLDEVAEVKGQAFNSSKYKPAPKLASKTQTRKASTSSNNKVSPATLRRQIRTLKAELRALRKESTSTSSSTNRKKKSNKSKKPSFTVRRRKT